MPAVPPSPLVARLRAGASAVPARRWAWTSAVVPAAVWASPPAGHTERQRQHFCASNTTGHPSTPAGRMQGAGRRLRGGGDGGTRPGWEGEDGGESSALCLRPSSPTLPQSHSPSSPRCPDPQRCHPASPHRDRAMHRRASGGPLQPPRAALPPSPSPPPGARPVPCAAAMRGLAPAPAALRPRPHAGAPRHAGTQRGRGRRSGEGGGGGAGGGGGRRGNGGGGVAAGAAGWGLGCRFLCVCVCGRGVPP